MNAQADYRRRSLVATKWASLVMAVSGVLAAWLSRSDALMLDGLFSGLGFFSAIIAIKVAESIGRPPDRRRPFGYEIDQPLFVTFRSLVLLGIIGFAGFAAIEKILAYLAGAEIEQLVLGPILIYSIAMATLAFSLAAFHRANLRKDGSNDMMLRAEFQGALLDGAITVGAGGALLASPLLLSTPAAVIVPVIDSVVVLTLSIFFLKEPISILKQAVGELAGVAADEKDVAVVRAIAEDVMRETPFGLTEVVLQRIGPRHMVAVLSKPRRPVSGSEVDELRERISDRCESEIGSSRVEILISDEEAFDNPAGAT